MEQSVVIGQCNQIVSRANQMSTNHMNIFHCQFCSDEIVLMLGIDSGYSLEFLLIFHVNLFLEMVIIN